MSRQAGTLPRLRMVSLNINGLGDQAKRRTLFSMLQRREDGVDIILLQETHCGSQQTALAWMGEGAGRGMPWMGKSAWACGTSASCGVAILVGNHVNIDNWSVDHMDDQGRVVVVSFSTHGSRLRLVSVYAPCESAERASFFSGPFMAALPGANMEAITLVGGDFNCIEDARLDQSHGCGSRLVGFADGLLPAQRRLGLVDIYRAQHPQGRAFTFTSGSSGSSARLDRWLVEDEAADRVVSVGQLIGWPGDHMAVIIDLEFKTAALQGPGTWGFPVALLTDGELVEGLKEAVKEWLETRPVTADRSARCRWELLKRFIRDYTRRYCSQTARRRAAAHAAPYSAAAEASRRLSADPFDSEAIVALQAADSAILEERRRNALRAARAAGVLWEDFGETSSAWFHRLGRQRRAATTIFSLVDAVPQREDVVSGSIELTTKETVSRARQILAAYFDGDRPGALYAPRQTDEEAQQQLLGSLDTRLSADEAAVCEGQLGPAGISVEELQQALTASAGGKVPGCDGLPYEFYTRFWSVVGQPLTEALNEAFGEDDGQLCDSMREGRIVLVYKGKGSRELVKSYRPITLLNCDYKLLAKAITRRFERVVGSVVDSTQTAFIPGRWIGDNVQYHLEECDYLEATGQPGCLLMLDFQQAYDRIDRSWVFQCLAAMGFGPAAIRWVRLLLKDTVASCLFNGWQSDKFRVRSGVAQGSPLSPLLYVIAAQPLAAHLRMLQQQQVFHSVRLPDGSTAPPSHQHADDTTIHTASIEDARTAWRRGVVVFCKASGAQVNASKTVAVLLGSASAPAARLDDEEIGIKVAAESEAVRHLGVMLGRGDVGVQAREAKFLQIAGTICSRISHWSCILLSDHGRAHVAKQLMASCLVYHAVFSQPAVSTLQTMDSAIRRFVAGGEGNMFPRREIAQLPWRLGGRDVVCLEAVVTSLLSGIVVRLLDPRPHPWKVLMRDWFSRLQGSGVQGLGVRVLMCGVDLPQVMRGVPRRVIDHVMSFRSLDPCRLTAAAQLTITQQLLEPLFFNPSISDDAGTFLWPNDFPICVSVSCTTVLGYWELRGRESQLSAELRAELDRISDAMPGSWRSAPATLPASGWWEVLDDDGECHGSIVFIDDEGNSRRYTSQHGRVISDDGGANGDARSLGRRCVVTRVTSGNDDSLWMVGTVGGPEAAFLDPSVWGVAGTPLHTSTVRDRTSYSIQLTTSLSVEAFSMGQPMRPKAWSCGTSCELVDREQRWVTLVERSTSVRRGRDDIGPAPAWMRRAHPRLLPMERAQQRLSVPTGTALPRLSIWQRRCLELERSVAAGGGTAADGATAGGATAGGVTVDGAATGSAAACGAVEGRLVADGAAGGGEVAAHGAADAANGAAEGVMTAERAAGGGATASGAPASTAAAVGATVATVATAGGAEADSAGACRRDMSRLPWHNVWMALKRAPIPREHKYVAWRLLHAALPCGAWKGSISRLRGTGEGTRGEVAVHCDVLECGAAGDIETLSHIFLSCPVAAAVWSWVAQLWVAVTERRPPVPSMQVHIVGDRAAWDPGDSAGLRELWLILRMATIFYLWGARMGGSVPAAQRARKVVAQVVAYLRLRMQQDIMRQGGQWDRQRIDGGQRIHKMPFMTPEAFEDRWCHRRVLCRRDTDGYAILLSTSFPAMLR